MRPIKYVEVTWIDSHTKWGWRDRQEIVQHAGHLECVSVGVILVQNKEVLVLAASSSEDNDNVADVTTIPVVCVRKIRRLR